MSPNNHHGPACRPNDPDEKLPLREVIRRGRPGPPSPAGSATGQGPSSATAPAPPARVIATAICASSTGPRQAPGSITAASTPEPSACCKIGQGQRRSWPAITYSVLPVISMSLLAPALPMRSAMDNPPWGSGSNPRLLVMTIGNSALYLSLITV